jgi:hypothetical protein
MQEEDENAPARGIINGIIIGATIWVLILSLWW